MLARLALLAVGALALSSCSTAEAGTSPANCPTFGICKIGTAYFPDGTSMSTAASGTVPGACSSGQVLTSTGAAFACTANINANNLTCSGTCVSDAEIAAVAASKLTGQVSQANGGTGTTALTCSAGQFLTSNGSAYSCATPSAGVTGSGTAAQLAYWSGTSAIAGSTKFTVSTGADEYVYLHPNASTTMYLYSESTTGIGGFQFQNRLGDTNMMIVGIRNASGKRVLDVLSGTLYLQSQNVDIGTLSPTGDLAMGGGVTGSNLSGTNTGDLTLTSVGSSPNANGASLSGQQLQLQPASASNRGVVNTTQTVIAHALVSTSCTSSPCTVDASSGVTSITRASTGVYTVTLSTARPNALWVMGATRSGTTFGAITATAESTTQGTIACANTLFTAADCAFQLWVFDND